MITHLVFDGVAESSLSIGVDIVASAARLASSGLVDIPQANRLLGQRVVSVDGRPVQSGAGRTIAVDGALKLQNSGPSDVLVIPGWFAATERSVARSLLQTQAQRATELMEAARPRGALVAASCSSTFLLASTGALDGHQATTTWWLAGAFARRFPAVRLSADRMVVEAPNALTAGSAFAHTDLMLAVLSRLAGPTLSQWVARYLLLDNRPSQSRYMAVEHLRVSDPALQKAERYIAENLDRQITLDELASVAAISSRTLSRRMHAGLGMTPQEFVQRQRVTHASHLLQTSKCSVEEVSARVGYADPAAFRRIFRRYTGESPRAARKMEP